MAKTEPAGAAPVAASDKDEEKVAKQQEFDQKQQELRDAQNLSGNAVPEQRPIASQTVDDPHSRVYKELKEAGDARANDEPMPREAYVKAASSAQAQKAADSSQTPQRLYVGARCYVDNPGSPDDGRAVAINRVVSWASVQDQVVAASGGEGAQFSQPAEYECMSRDGRAELMIVSAEHLRPASEQVDWGRTTIQ